MFFLVINNFIHLAQKIINFEVIEMDTPSLYSYTSKYLNELEYALITTFLFSSWVFDECLGNLGGFDLSRLCVR